MASVEGISAPSWLRSPWVKWSWLLVLAVVIVQSINYHWRLFPTTASGYFARGRGDYLHGHDDAAIQNFTKAITLDPKDADALSWRGEAYIHLHDLPRAMADLTRAVKLRPDYDKAHSALGDGKAAAWDMDGAIEEYTRAIALSTDYARCYFDRGLVLYDVGRWNEAAADLRRATAMLVGDKQVTAALMLWLARAQAGEATAATAELRQLAATGRIKGHRFATAERFLAGDATEAEFLPAFKGLDDGDAGELAAEAAFLAGSKRVAAGDAAGGTALLREALATDAGSFYAGARARAALERSLLGTRTMWIDDTRAELAVTSTVAGGPADSVGVKPGHVIVSIDKGPATQRALIDVLAKGAPGSNVVLVLGDPLDYRPKAQVTIKLGSSAPTR